MPHGFWDRTIRSPRMIMIWMRDEPLSQAGSAVMRRRRWEDYNGNTMPPTILPIVAKLVFIGEPLTVQPSSRCGELIAR